MTEWSDVTFKFRRVGPSPLFPDTGHLWEVQRGDETRFINCAAATVDEFIDLEFNKHSLRMAKTLQTLDPPTPAERESWRKQKQLERER